MDKYNEYIKEQFNIDDKVLALVDEAESALAERFAGIDDITAICQMKVLKAFQENHINATHFDWSTGYGYDDAGREAVEDLSLRAGWSRSTTLTMLRRMTDKGLISCDEAGAVLQYSPLINRDVAVQRETGNFLKRVYNGSVSMLISAMAKEQKLTKSELEELKEILRHAEEA